MKKTLSIVLSLIMIISTLAIAPFSANAAIGGYCGANLIWRFTSDNALTISGTGAMDDMQANKQPWVDYKDQIQSVTIESGVTTIGAYAFHQLENLKNVTIPNTVTTIGLQAFGECTGLESLVIPSSVTKIYSYALWNVSCNVYYAGSETSSNNWGAVHSIIRSNPNDYVVGTNINANFKDGTLTISGTGAMHDYNIDNKDLPPWADKEASIKKVVIENGITTIGELAFCNYDSLEEVVMADSVTAIGELAFEWCSSLKKVTFSNNLQTIGDGAFVGCESLTSVSLPSSLKTIGDAAFNYAGIQTLNVPISVTKIGIAAFGDIPLVVYHGTATDPEGENWRAIQLKRHTYSTTVSTTKATTSADGKIVKKCSCGATTSTVIKKASNIKLSTTKYTYDGKVKSPTLTVKDSAGKTLVKGTDYTVTTPTGRKNVGKYTYKITFKGNYTGTKSVSFTIVPKSTTISSLTAASKGFTVKYKKQATQTTGYQIQIATDSKFTKGVKSYDVTKNTTLSKKITKLTGKKKYYVRIRTYKTVSGTKYYSSWSGSKYVTTKK